MEPLKHPEDRFARDVTMPLEPEEHLTQLELLRSFFSSDPKSILDLGCGAGRLLCPLREAGHRVVGLDHDERALAWAAQACGTRDELVQQDLRDATQPFLNGPFDAALLLGNTLMELVSPAEVLDLLHRLEACLSDEGVLIIEDIPGLYWPLLSSGQWGDGEAEGIRMVWSDRDMIFSLREGEAVQDDSPLHPDEPLRRLWSESLLQTVLHQAGWESSPGEHPLLRVARPVRSVRS